MQPSTQELQIEISISNWQSGGAFRLSNRIKLDNISFGDMAKILEAYDKLTKDFSDRMIEGNLS